MMLNLFPALGHSSAVDLSMIAQGAAAGWVAKCWVWDCVAQVLAFFARSAALCVGIPLGGVCEYTTCSDQGALKGADNG